MSPARRQAVKTLARQFRSAPNLAVMSVDTSTLDPRDARLAVAIHRTVLQRWLTLEYLLDQHMRKPLRKAEPMMQAILLAGAAQIVFMRKIPAHAAIDESVGLAKQIIRAGAGKLANAVLRKLAEDVVGYEDDAEYVPGRDVLPGVPGVVRLARPLLPEAPDELLAVATSHPVELVRRWKNPELLMHSLQHAPTIVRSDDTPPETLATPHQRAGFYIWRSTHTDLVEYLEAAGRGGRWVQDPTSAAPVAATADMTPKLIIDFCAGRGTKSRQLAHLHPQAKIIATDPDPERFESLKQVPGIEAVSIEQMAQYTGSADLLLLDVPCSNTGVLARRLEARYRFHPGSLASLTQLQREIAEQAAPLLAPGGAVLYATCSIEPEENQQQAEALADRLNRSITRSEQTLPGGAEADYHDGGFFALMV